jgi:ribosomal protein S27E
MNSTLQRFPCVECGSQLGFGPGQQRLVCSHCGKEQTVPSFPSTRLGAQRGLPIERAEAHPSMPPSETEVEEFLCPNCGARTTVDGTSFALICPYCSTSLSHTATENLQVWPKAILPFAVPESDAYRSALAKLQDTALAPPDLASDVRLRPTLKGVYLPFWVFGTDSETAYTVNRGKYEYEEVTAEGFVTYARKAEWTRIYGHLPVPLNDILVAASPNPPRPFDAALAPWDFADLVPFQQHYLTGFHAEMSTIPAVEAHRTARHVMHGAIHREIHRKVEADAIDLVRCDTHFSHETFKLVLLPFWIADYRAQGKTLLVYVNGQTGKALAQVAETDPRVGWSGWRAMLLLGPVLIAIIWILFGAGSDLVRWYGPALVNYFLTP